MNAPRVDRAGDHVKLLELEGKVQFLAVTTREKNCVRAGNCITKEQWGAIDTVWLLRPGCSCGFGGLLEQALQGRVQPSELHTPGISLLDQPG